MPYRVAKLPDGRLENIVTAHWVLSTLFERMLKVLGGAGA